MLLIGMPRAVLPARAHHVTQEPPMRMRPLLRAISIGSAVLLSLTVAGAAAANSSVTASMTTVPTDQPLPGYTINNPPLPPATSNGAPTRVLQGVHGHAAYTVEVPAAWNGDLVVWTH